MPRGASSASARHTPRPLLLLVTLVLALGNVTGNLADLVLTVTQVLQLALKHLQVLAFLFALGRFRTRNLIAFITLAIDRGPVVDAHLHGADHLQFGDLVDQARVG